MDPAAIIDALQDPQTRHAALVHLPIALSVLALVPVFVSALFAGRKLSVWWFAFGAYALLLLTGLVAVNSGEAADGEIVGQLPAEVYAAIDDHEDHARRTWIFASATMVLIVGSSLRPKAVRTACAWLAVAAGVAAAGWMGITAHHGGVLVYEWGLGTPNAPHAAPAPGAGETDPSKDDGAAPPADPRVVHFRERVLPILEGQCMRCHNPQRQRRAGGLDQTTMAGLLAGGHGGPALVPGNPEASLMISAVRWADPDLEMPPDADKLGDEDIAALVEWVRDGAVWSPPAAASDGDRPSPP